MLGVQMVSSLQKEEKEIQLFAQNATQMFQRFPRASYEVFLYLSTKGSLL